MGTNYYRVRIPSEMDMYKMHQMIDDHMFESKRGCWEDGKEVTDVTCVQDLIEDCTKSVHICKMSYGWKTNFDHNWGKYYKPNRESLEKFLSEPNTVIKDEYGEMFTPDQFWEMIEQHDTCKRCDGGEPFTDRTYDEVNMSEHKSYPCFEDRKKCKSLFGIETNYDDFIVDGLRFSVFTDFC